MPELRLPWLELAIFLPLLSSIILPLLRAARLARAVSLALCSLIFLLTLGEWIDFTLLGRFEAHDHWDVIQYVFDRELFVVDELSTPLLPLVALLYLMTILSTLRSKAGRVPYSGMMLSEGILLATISCREPWVLTFLLVAGTIPPAFEIRSRGHSTRVYSFHMLVFACSLLLGQSMVASSQPDGWGLLVGGSLLTGACLLRSGVVPLHCWMADLFDKASFGTSLLFVTPMVGVYGIMRLVLPIAPDWALHSISHVSLVTAVYAAGMAVVQREARRYFCYLFLSFSSLVLVGMELVTPIGLTGALCVWMSAGLSMAGFGITLRAVEARVGRISLQNYHGLYEQMPTLAALFLITGLAAIGFPGTIGFIGIELLIEGAFAVNPLGGTMVVLSAALNGIAILYAYFRIFTGSRHITSVCLRARMSERFAVFILTAIILGGGLYPQPGIASRYHAAVELIKQRRGQTEIPNLPSHQSETH